MSQTRVDGTTPHGGDYALLTFFGADGQPLPDKNGAVAVDVEEWTADGHRLAKTYLRGGDLPARADQPPHGPVDESDESGATSWDLWVSTSDGQLRRLDSWDLLMMYPPFLHWPDDDQKIFDELSDWIVSAKWDNAPARLKEQVYAWMDRHREAATAS